MSEINTYCRYISRADRREYCVSDFSFIYGNGPVVEEFVTFYDVRQGGKFTLPVSAFMEQFYLKPEDDE